MKPSEKDAVEREVRRIADASPYDIYDLRIGQDRSVHVLLDRKQGRLSVDDAARFNHQLRRDLLATGLDVDAWSIQVESPGAFRPLRVPRHYERAVGERVRIVVRGQGQLVIGVLKAVDASGVVVLPDEGGDAIPVTFADVASARLDPRLPF